MKAQVKPGILPIGTIALVSVVSILNGSCNVFSSPRGRAVIPHAGRASFPSGAPAHLDEVEVVPPVRAEHLRLEGVEALEHRLARGRLQAHEGREPRRGARAAALLELIGKS